MTRRKMIDPVEAVKVVPVGSVDPMSKMAASASLPTCLRTRKGRPCTRVLGHREAGLGHPAHLHVSAPGPDYVAKEVW